MNRIKELADAISPAALLQHPFYQSWSAGTLPVETLSLYATEYGKFIRLIPKGFETLGETEVAEVEKGHSEMWGAFIKGLPAPPDAKPVQIQALTAAAESLFNDKPEAIGALYAFEVQQPATATSKLAGLKTHYSLPESAEEYFAAHAGDQSDAELLTEKIIALSEEEYRRAFGACRLMACALWAALDGVYYA